MVALELERTALKTQQAQVELERAHLYQDHQELLMELTQENAHKSHVHKEIQETVEGLSRAQVVLQQHINSADGKS